VPEGMKPDIDLTKYDGEELGVSRQHATLRPTKDELVLLDLGSRNGTFCNATQVKLGAPQKVKDGDTISFGGLHFKVQIVSQPA
jgi:pSer/pThr/pTyr-binding forkhead associated (FHA) protein